MFELQHGLILALYARADLAKDANVPLGQPKTGEFSIGHAVATKAEVDALLSEASTDICGRSSGTLGWTEGRRRE